MSDPVKICAMCRKEVDAGAVLCPYCNSSTDYNYFTAIPEVQLVRIDNKTKAVTQVVVGIVAVGGCFWLGFVFGGFWIGAGAAAVAYQICASIGKDSPSDNYHHHFCCPSCSKEEDVVWGVEKFETLKSGFMECSGCHKKTMIARA